jgi:hypothetical protein
MIDLYYILIDGKHFGLSSPVEQAIARRALTKAGIERATVMFGPCTTPMSLTADRALPAKSKPSLRLIQGGKQ